MKKRRSILIVMLSLLLAFAIPLSLFPDEVKKLSFGDKIESMLSKDTENDTVVVPAENTVTVLFFFNITNSSHLTTVSKLNSLFVDMSSEGKKATIVFVSKGDHQDFKNAVITANLKFPVINDEEEKIMGYFNFTCGV